MLSNSLLAYILAGLGIAVVVVSKFFNVIEWFFRRNADRKIETTDKSIEKAKGELNEIHSSNVTNMSEYERAKREYDSDSSNGKKDQ